MNHRTLLSLVLLGASLSSVGCNFYARSQKDYRDDTTKVLATKNAELDGCYDNVLKATPGVKGKVVVQFTVTEKTGKIADVKADAARTNAPQPLVDCVVNAINGLALDPADQRKGLATFEYEFAQKKAK
jgi:hypothetical protein